MDEDGFDDDDDRAAEIDVWGCHLDAVQVFGLCTIECVATMGGLYWTGISPAAIRAACELLRLPRDAWPSIGEDVAFMGRAVAEHRNRVAAAKSGTR